MTANVSISGTDPTNPRNASHIVVRLEQIERDAAAMAAEVVRLRMFSGFIRGLLMDQGRIATTAQMTAEQVGRRLDALRAQLDAASEYANHAQADIVDSKVILSARFEWKPARQSEGR